MHEMAKRVKELPPYVFSQINVLKAEAQKKGISLMSLAIGDPDQPTPIVLVEKMKEAISKSENHMYSPYEGSLLFRKAVAQWFERRFNVSLDPNQEVLALIGSKEGIAHLPVALCNPGDVTLYPSPGYPVFQTSLLLAGTRALPLPMMAENGFLPDLKTVESLFKTHSPKYCLLNFPSNPTSAVCPLEILAEIVGLAKKYQVILVSDNAYSEIYYDENKRPPSLLQIPGAKEVAIEFHSLSKTFNMTGWRLGFAVGNRDLVGALLKLKTNIDSGPLLSVQETGAYALDQSEKITPAIRGVYAKRMAVLKKGLDRLAIEYLNPLATFFVWAKIPNGEKSFDFAKNLIEKKGLVLTPGIGFGTDGENFFRLALTVPEPQIELALTRLEEYLKP